MEASGNENSKGTSSSTSSFSSSSKDLYQMNHAPSPSYPSTFQSLPEFLLFLEQLNQSFPYRLYDLLDCKLSQDIVRWHENGICFRILQPKELANQILPILFKQNKLTSFLRQLNAYGFCKIRDGGEKDFYFHPYFQVDRRDLLRKMKRLTKRQTLPSYFTILAKKQNASTPVKANEILSIEAGGRSLSAAISSSLSGSSNAQPMQIRQITSSKRTVRSVVDDMHAQLLGNFGQYPSTNYPGVQPLMMYPNSLPMFLYPQTAVPLASRYYFPQQRMDISNYHFSNFLASLQMNVAPSDSFSSLDNDHPEEENEDDDDGNDEHSSSSSNDQDDER